MLIMKAQLEGATNDGDLDTMSKTIDDIANTDFINDFKEDSEKKHSKVKFDDYALNNTKDKEEHKPLKKQSKYYCKIINSKNL